jgi:hypothetical protein
MEPIKLIFNRILLVVAILTLPFDALTVWKHLVIFMENKTFFAIFMFVNGAAFIIIFKWLLFKILDRFEVFKIIFPDGSIGFNKLSEIPTHFKGKIEIIPMTKQERRNYNDKKWFEKAQKDRMK